MPATRSMMSPIPICEYLFITLMIKLLREKFIKMIAYLTIFLILRTAFNPDAIGTIV